MSFLDSLMISVFGLGLVFIILISLCFFIIIESKIIALFLNKKKAEPANNETVVASANEPVLDTGATCGELKLLGVDEKTAAMIMAIVSDESSIPLSELQFKSIKAVE